MNKTRQAKLLDIVAVLNPPPDGDVEVGDVGTVVELLPPDGLEVEFLQRDILSQPLDEQFDYVCLLNVIHHLDEPIRAIHQLAAIARELLVIEFPTFEDPKFRKTTRIRFPKRYNRLPLIGVSSKRATSKKADGGQTFVFSPDAITRILQDHRPLFSQIKIIDSPVSGRKIALCRK